MIFVDSAALLALVDPDDSQHLAAVEYLEQNKSEILTTHSYVSVEAMAVARRRLDHVSNRVLIDGYLAALSVMYVDEELHRRAVAAYSAALDSSISFVDRVSFEFMRDRGIRDAFTFDRDFVREGFRCLP